MFSNNPRNGGSFAFEGVVKLSAREKYDYRDLDMIEAKRNLYGLDMPFGEIAANWAIRSAEQEGINAALESVWQAKREYRAELAKKRALRFSGYREAHKQICNASEASYGLRPFR
jgi:hypothetical protein